MAERLIFAGNQPTYLPWLGLFEQMAVCDLFVICDDFQLSNPSWHNRNKIKGSQGTLWLRIPLKHKGAVPLNQAELDDTKPWRKKHLRSVESNYRKSPYFETFWPRLQELYDKPCATLAEFTIPQMHFYAEALGLDVNFVLSSSLELEGHKEQRVIDLCHQVNCNVAYLATGTQAYVDPNAFKEEGVEIIFQAYGHPVYPQPWGNFVSHLGVLDLLMNCGPASGKILLSTSTTL